MIDPKRAIALRIVTLRKLLLAGMVAELLDDVLAYDKLLAQFEQQTRKLPLTLQHNLEKRVSEPARRKIEREGILAQSPGSTHVHRYERMAEIETWLCSCGASYMGGRS